MIICDRFNWNRSRAPRETSVHSHGSCAHARGTRKLARRMPMGRGQGVPRGGHPGTPMRQSCAQMSARRPKPATASPEGPARPTGRPCGRAARARCRRPPLEVGPGPVRWGSDDRPVLSVGPDARAASPRPCAVAAYVADIHRCVTTPRNDDGQAMRGCALLARRRSRIPRFSILSASGTSRLRTGLDEGRSLLLHVATAAGIVGDGRSDGKPNVPMGNVNDGP